MVKQINKINYQKEMEQIILKNEKENKVPTLLLHSCCGPCSSYVLEYLSDYFKITVFYYNPNIYPEDEYDDRINQQKKIIENTNAKYPINLIEGEYNTKFFYDLVKGLEKCPEGGERCEKCYRFRLEKAAIVAKENGFDYFTTTLTISPHKNSQILNKIAQEVSEKIGIENLASDFKKRNGYKRSVELSSENGLYRQDYCGCVFSKVEVEKKRLEKEKL